MGDVCSIHQFELDQFRSSHASLIRVGLPNTGPDLAIRHSNSQIGSTRRHTSLWRPHPASKVDVRIPRTHPRERRLHPNTAEYIGDSTELVYLRARYYAPAMGRFLTKDVSEGTNNGKGREFDFLLGGCKPT